MQISHATPDRGVFKSMTWTQATPATSFPQALAARDTALDRSPMRPTDLARQTAQQLVATALVQPLLAQLRNDPFKTDLFHGGQAEEIFGQQLDTILSDRLVQGTSLPVVDAVYQTLLRRSGATEKNRIDLVHRG